MYQYQIQFSQAILAFVWAFLLAVFAIPSIIYMAHVKNLLDEPNKRTVHVSKTPRLGGMAIFAGFMSALTIFGDFGADSKGIQQILAGCVIIFFIGLKDDVVPVSAFKKFFVQVLATGIVMFIGDIRITSLQGLINVYELDIGISYTLTFLLIVGITNAINLIDGLDGLAGGIVLTISCVFGTFFFLENSPYAIMASCLIGSVMGFLRYNFRNATIFMGDTGSLVCGFIVAVMSVRLIELRPQVIENHTIVLCLATLLIPVTDTLKVFAMRTLAGISPFTPDRNHLHHRLKDMGVKPMYIVFILIGVTLFAVSCVIYLIHLSPNILLLLIVTIGVTFSMLIEVINKKRIKKATSEKLA